MSVFVVVTDGVDIKTCDPGHSSGTEGVGNRCQPEAMGKSVLVLSGQMSALMVFAGRQH